MPTSWTDAGIILARNPTKEVECPNCSAANIEVSVHYVAGLTTFERILRCPSCGAVNTLRMTYKNPPPVLKPNGFATLSVGE